MCFKKIFTKRNISFISKIILIEFILIHIIVVLVLKLKSLPKEWAKFYEDYYLGVSVTRILCKTIRT